MVVDPWEPVGTAAEQAGVALLLAACALLLAPWALVVRAGPYITVALLVCALVYADVGTATLHSGLSGEVVHPVVGDTAFRLWFFVATPVLMWTAVRARGWARASAVLLVLASPLVMAFSYAIGPFDAKTWTRPPLPSRRRTRRCHRGSGPNQLRRQDHIPPAATDTRAQI